MYKRNIALVYCLLIDSKAEINNSKKYQKEKSNSKRKKKIEVSFLYENHYNKEKKSLRKVLKTSR